MVVVDVFMPGVGGLDTIKLVHARAPGVPLIAISGHVFVDHPFPDQFRKLALTAASPRLRFSSAARACPSMVLGMPSNSSGRWG